MRQLTKYMYNKISTNVVVTCASQMLDNNSLTDV